MNTNANNEQRSGYANRWVPPAVHNWGNRASRRDRFKALFPNYEAYQAWQAYEERARDGQALLVYGDTLHEQSELIRVGPWMESQDTPAFSMQEDLDAIVMQGSPRGSLAKEVRRRIRSRQQQVQGDSSLPDDTRMHSISLHQAYFSNETGLPKHPSESRGRFDGIGRVVTRAVANLLANQFVSQLEKICPSLTVRLGRSAGQEAYLTRINHSLESYLLDDEAILSNLHPFLRFVLKSSICYLGQHMALDRTRLSEKAAAMGMDDNVRRRAKPSRILDFNGSGGYYCEEPTEAVSKLDIAKRVSEDDRPAFSLPLRTYLPSNATRTEIVLYSMTCTSKSPWIRGFLKEDRASALERVLGESFSFLPDLQQFQDLAHECHVAWYQTTSSRLTEEGVITNAHGGYAFELPTQPLTYIRTDWDPFPMVRQLREMGERYSLTKVLTITGNLHISYAAACEDFVSQTWPHIGPRLLQQLDSAIERSWKHHNSEQQGADSPPIRLEAQSNDPSAKVYRIELKASIVAMTFKAAARDFGSMLQMLSWLSAALRMPEQADGPEGVDVTVFKKRGSYRIVTEARKLELDGSRHCWTKLLDRAVIAHGFPIPDRGLGRGLEMSLRTACQLIGATKAINCAEGPVIKGLSGTLLPVRAIDKSIQWHLLVREPSNFMRSPLQELKKFPNRLTFKNTSSEIMDTIFESLADPEASCYIGWHPKAASFAGADPAVIDYSAIRKSGLKSPGQKFQFKNFTLGFQHFVTAEVEVGAIPIQSTLWLRRNHYWLDDLLIQAERSRVLLYDIPTQRGWLLSTAEAVLHLLRGQLVPHHGFKLDTRDSAKETLKVNSVKTVQEGLTVADMIVDRLEVIERLQAELSNCDTDRYFSTKLFGFDFIQCANRTGSFVLREAHMAGMPLGRSWVDFIHASETPVLFGGGFGELIGLHEDDQTMTCSMWRKVPCNVHLMAATAQVMMQIYAEEPNSDSDECRSLTHLKLLWDQGSSKLHESCNDPRSGCCCQRVQMLRTRGLLRSQQIQAPASIPETGAVIFGDPDMVKGAPKVRKARKAPEAQKAPKTPKAAAVRQKSVASEDRKPNPALGLATSEDQGAPGPKELTQIEEHMRKIMTR